MKIWIEERAKEVAKYVILNKCTIRAAAKQFGVCKSTIHKDITERLVTASPQLAKEAELILAMNKATRSSHGGEATRLKYKRLRGLEHEIANAYKETI